LNGSVEDKPIERTGDSTMLAKVAFGLAVVLASASVSIAATHVKPRTNGRKIHIPAPVTYPVENCNVRVPFPSCSGASGGSM
jgi:hypothetical protein